MKTWERRGPGRASAGSDQHCGDARSPGRAAEDDASCVQGLALPGADRRPRPEVSAALGSEPLISLQERRRT